jgi:peroxiredoxin
MDPASRLRRTAVHLLVPALAILLISGCSSDQAGAAADAGFVAGDGSIVVLDPGQRASAPAVTGVTLDGQSFDLTSLRGEVVVLNVWASWCAPCRSEAPTLQGLWSELKDDGVRFIGLDTRDSPAAAQAFIERFGITYPNVVDEDGRIQLLFRDTLPPQAIPSTVVIDEQGRVAARMLGEVSEASLRGVIDEVRAPAP